MSHICWELGFSFPFRRWSATTVMATVYSLYNLKAIVTESLRLGNDSFDANISQRFISPVAFWYVDLLGTKCMGYLVFLNYVQMSVLSCHWVSGNNSWGGADFMPKAPRPSDPFTRGGKTTAQAVSRARQKDNEQCSKQWRSNVQNHGWIQKSRKHVSNEVRLRLHWMAGVSIVVQEPDDDMIPPPLNSWQPSSMSPTVWKLWTTREHQNSKLAQRAVTDQVGWERSR